MNEAPSLQSTKLLPMLSNSVDSILPATLGMIRKSDHYAIAVEYITQQVLPELSKSASNVSPGVPMLRHCSRVVTLVLSTKPSKVSAAGAGGHRLVSVFDFVAPDTGATQKNYGLAPFCILDTVTDFKLDPPTRARS